MSTIIFCFLFCNRNKMTWYDLGGHVSSRDSCGKCDVRTRRLRQGHFATVGAGRQQSCGHDNDGSEDTFAEHLLTSEFAHEEDSTCGHCFAWERGRPRPPQMRARAPAFPESAAKVAKSSETPAKRCWQRVDNLRSICYKYC